MFAICVLLIVSAWIGFIIYRTRRPQVTTPPLAPAQPDNNTPRPPRRLTTYGSARLATWQEINDAGLLDYGRADAPKFLKGIMVGQASDPASGYTASDPIGYSGPGHLLTVAPTRSGKLVTVLAHALAFFRGSCVTIDPKSQAEMMLARARQRLGNEVVSLRPFEDHADKLGPTACYNPVDTINPSSRGFGSDCENLTDALITRDANEGNSRHFNDGAASIWCGGLRHLVKFCPPHMRNLPTLRSIICNDDVFKDFCRQACATGDQITADKLGRFREFNSDSREIQDVLATARTQSNFIGNEAIAASLMSSSFRFRNLKRKPTTVFVGLPTRYIDANGKYFRLIVASMLNELLEGPPGIPVLGVLDEFPQYGRLTALETAMKIAAGYGLQLWPFCTDLASLRMVYGENFSSFVANASCRQFFAPQDPFTAEYISKLCGVTTVIANNISNREISYAEAGGGFTGVSSSTSHAPRPLYTPDEVMRMEGYQQLLFIDNLPPILALRYPYWTSPDMAALIDPNPEHPGAIAAPANDNVPRIEQRRA